MPNPHLNSAVLSHFLARGAHGEKSRVARDAQITPGHLYDLEVGRNFGTRLDLRERLADALGVDPATITCWCDRPGGTCRARVEATP